MEFYYEIDPAFVIPEQRMDNSDCMEQKISSAAEEDKGALRSILRFIYFEDGPDNVDPQRYKASVAYLNEAELIVLNWLRTRTNGKLRKIYGKKVLKAARQAKYKCEVCKFPDVRTLQLDHINGRNVETEFSCLCANCHQIKSRKTMKENILTEDILIDTVINIVEKSS